MINRTNTRRIAIALALGGALLVSYPAVSGGVLWDVGAACGYVCLVLFVCLYIFPVRGDGLPHARLLGLSQHKFIGWSLLVAAGAHVAALGLIALLPATTAKHFLLEPVAKPAMIAVNFPHDLHTSVSCVTCHHNYVDHTGTTACIECHRSSRTDLGRSSEQTFHTFCRDCHTQLALDSRKHGPTRSCAACHQGIRSNNL